MGNSNHKLSIGSNSSKHSEDVKNKYDLNIDVGNLVSVMC